eukprot:scaffold128136_cov61-Phaeocystis_antarctica.AAC.3
MGLQPRAHKAAALSTWGSADRLLVRQLGDAGHDEIDELVRRVAHPLVAPLVQVGLGEGDEGEAAVDEVRLRLVVDVRRHEARLRVKLRLRVRRHEARLGIDGHVDDHLLTFAQEAQLYRLAGKLEMDQ